MQDTILRGEVLHFLHDPGPDDDAAAWQHWPDGYVAMRHGHIAGCGDWAALSAHRLAAANVHDHRGRLILPGLIDCHLHYAQVGIIGAFGHQLLDWLQDYTFPAEAAFADAELARRTADFVLDRLLAHGTTTAAVFATVHPVSVDALMAAALARNMRLIGGKVLMDRHAPAALCDGAERGAAESAALIARWHGKGRLAYAVTPRFAPTSTPRQLQLAGELYAGTPGLYVQSHLAENHSECQWVAQLFPGHGDYLDVYRHYGLLGPRCIYGHGIHLHDAQRQLLAESGTAIAFCPSSNLFLGSGFFDYRAARQAGVAVGLASDIGAGTSLSLIRTLADGYKVSQCLQQPLPPLRGWYLATLAGAQALRLEHCLGNFAVGKEADCVVLDMAATPELAFRLQGEHTLAQRLFALATLGDERCVAATYVAGRRWQAPAG
ncbi:guanine deaminase [Vogesella sp. GCM10023246]|uniref:Guanine deaminase n=1 Tax=Vogesella oryzagri TaxID=3160864 RepID=A0ABV1M5H4_9NEIS